MTAPSDDVQVIHLDEVEPIRVGDFAGDWVPLRRLLDVRAFGINVWFAAAAGDRAVEEHDEDAGPGTAGQEELYVVLRGAARFTVGDRDIDAPAGTVVYVRDPKLTRGAVALEDDTATLTVGGERGTFSPSEWEDRWMDRYAG